MTCIQVLCRPDYPLPYSSWDCHEQLRLLISWRTTEVQLHGSEPTAYQLPMYCWTRQLCCSGQLLMGCSSSWIAVETARGLHTLIIFVLRIVIAVERQLVLPFNCYNQLLHSCQLLLCKLFSYWLQTNIASLLLRLTYKFVFSKMAAIDKCHPVILKSFHPFVVFQLLDIVCQHGQYINW